jgi:FkbM family methyltransferase
MMWRSLRSTRPWARLMKCLRWAGPILPASVFSHLWFKGTFDARVGGARFRIRHVGAEIENEIFWRGTFDRERLVTRLIADHVRSFDVFLDVGANSGFYSLLAQAVNPNAFVAAFEPSPANAAVLRDNVALNEFAIECLEAAVTDRSGPVTLFDFPGFSYSASLVEGFRPGTSVRTVQGVTLDDFLELRGLAGKSVLCKIDVEGHELAVLQGAKRLLAAGTTAVVELLSSKAVHEAAAECGGNYRFGYVNEETGEVEEVTSRIQQQGPLPAGNYLLQPLQ